MTPRNAFNQRYSKGALYSARERRELMELLAARGYSWVEDNTTMGFAVYHQTKNGVKTGEAAIFLDDLGCDPINSGMMTISSDKHAATLVTIWSYLKENRPPVTQRIAKTIRRLF